MKKGFDANKYIEEQSKYILERIKKSNTYEATPFPFRNLTRDLLIEMVEEAVDLRIRKNDLFSYRKIESLFNKEDTWLCNLNEEK